MSSKEKLLALDIVENNEFLDKYTQIIHASKNLARVKHKTQKHHIIPKVVFIHNNKPIDNTGSNIVNLIYKDHILAHYYLFMCAKGWFKASAAKAVVYLVNRIESITTKTNAFNKIELNFSEEELLKLLPNLEEAREKANISEQKRLSGGKWVNNGCDQKYVGGSELVEFLQNNTEWSIGKLPISESTRQKYRNKKPNNVGTKTMNNGIINKFVPIDEINNYLELGWQLGRWDKADRSKLSGKVLSEEAKQKISDAKKANQNIPWNKGKKGLQQANITSFKAGMKPHNSGKRYVNNGIDEFFIPIDQLDEFLNKGFSLGRLPGSYKKTDKHKQNK